MKEGSENDPTTGLHYPPDNKDLSMASGLVGAGGTSLVGQYGQHGDKLNSTATL